MRWGALFQTRVFHRLEKYIQMSEDRQLDFDPEWAINISVGEVLLSQVGEARCASGGYGGWAAHFAGGLLRLFAHLECSTSRLHPTRHRHFDINVLRSDGTISAYNSSAVSPVGVTLPVTAGLTNQIDVVHVYPATREFELTTAMR